MSEHIQGHIHSIESFGTVDGPGVRLVVFMQGCPMRCKYCHNPDTWEIGGGRRMTAGEVLAEYERNKAFYANGGLTVTGGEPLLQIDFLLELFEMAKARGIHTCMDTSGITYRPEESAYNRKLDRLMEKTDLVMLDIKHTDSSAHRELTGHGNEGILAFARYLDQKHIPVWIRHVIVPGITDGEAEQRALGRLMAGLSNVKALDVLPYHTMGESKYREMGLAYPLAGVEALPAHKAKEARQNILAAYREEKQKRA